MCKPNKIANQQDKRPPKILCCTVAHCNIASWDFIHRIAAWRTSSNFAAILFSLLKSSQSPLASPNRNSLWFAKFRSSGSALNTNLVLLVYGDSSVLHCASLVHTIFTSLARANERVHVHNVGNFPQAKLDSEMFLFQPIRCISKVHKVAAYNQINKTYFWDIFIQCWFPLPNQTVQIPYHHHSPLPLLPPSSPPWYLLQRHQQQHLSWPQEPKRQMLQGSPGKLWANNKNRLAYVRVS